MSNPSAFADEEMVRFLAAPAPRAIPARLRKTALRETAPFGAGLFGFMFMLVGLGFAAVFFPTRQIDQWRLERGVAPEVMEARGRIVSAENTNLSINNVKVRVYRFEFTVPDGRRMEGECYTTGRRWSEGASVTVRYAADDPSLAVARGGRLGKTGWASGFVLLFPVAGALIFAWWVRARRRVVKLLIHGQLGDFVVVSVEPTSVSINKQPQFKITLKRVDAGEGETHTLRWHQPERLRWVNSRKTGGQAVFGLYDAGKPGRIVLPELWMQG